MRLWIILATTLAVICGAVSGCGGRKRPPATAANSLELISPRHFPGFGDDLPLESLKKAVESARSYLLGVDPDRMFTFGPDKYTASRLLDTLDAFEDILDSDPSPMELAEAVAENFMVYQSVGTDGDGEMLFTGYYEPLLEGSPDYDPKYPYPLYEPPEDLLCVDLGKFKSKYAGEKICGRVDGNSLVPYYTREEIDNHGGLEGEGFEIAWVKDPIDLFFLQIQGSGRIIDEQGNSYHVHYAGKNGRPYRSIGKLLIDEGEIPREEMSMQRLRAYLEENPHEVDRILNYNESYVFFSIVDQPALGYAEQPLVGGRCAAIDYRIFPMGALGYIVSRKPSEDSTEDYLTWEDMNRFVLSLDTGGAIRGPGRLDLFWGNGPYAELAAGHMKQEGKLYFLVVKE